MYVYVASFAYFFFFFVLFLSLLCGAFPEGSIVHSALDDIPRSHAIIGDIAGSVFYAEVSVRVTLTFWLEAACLRKKGLHGLLFEILAVFKPCSCLILYRHNCHCVIYASCLYVYNYETH